MDRYAVVGNPVAHTKSPEIHAAFARETGQQLVYERLLAPLDDFVGVAERFFAAGGRGLNVTVPFKGEAFQWVDEHDEFAGSAGTVNTIVPVADGFRGYNTDGLGLVRDLAANLRIDLAGRRILMLGAGGAVAGVIGPLLGCAPQRIDVVNRTHARAVTLTERFEDPRLQACALTDVAAAGYDLVINGTAAGLGGDRPILPDTAVRGAAVYDMAYGQAAKPFLGWARDAGARTVHDGVGMLVEQAAEAFFRWRHVRPQTRDVIAQMAGPS